MLKSGTCSLMVTVIFFEFKTSTFARIVVQTILTFEQFSSMRVLHLPSITTVVSEHLIKAKP